MTHPNTRYIGLVSIKNPSRLLMSLTIKVLRSPLSGPLARVSVTSLNASVSSSRKVSTWSLSTQPALAGLGSIAT